MGATDPKVPAISQTKAIKDYFFVGVPAAEVIAEMKKLAPEEKAELAEGAARELGATVAPPTKES